MGCCGEPSPCFGTIVERKDECMCGCPCPNGPVTIVVAQLLVFIGWCFTWGVIGDCSFVTIPGGVGIPALQNTGLFPNLGDFLPDNVATKRLGVGFYTFEQIDDTCYFYTDNTQVNDAIVRNYMDLLGNDWNTARSVGVTTVAFSFVVWLYMLSYSCSAQFKGIRYATGVVLCVVLVILQGLTFTVLGSSWCRDNYCEFSRAAGLSVGALLCFFFAGVCFFFTSDYPGVAPADQYGAAVVGTKDEEQQEVVVEEEKEEDIPVDEEAEVIGIEQDEEGDDKAGQEVSADAGALDEEEGGVADSSRSA